MARAVILLLALLGLALMGEPRIQFLRPPHFVNQGVTVFQLKVPPHADNRSVAVAAFDPNDGERVALSQRDVDAESLSVLRFSLWLPSGDLALLGVLYGSRGEIARTPAVPVRVRGKISED